MDYKDLVNEIFNYYGKQHSSYVKNVWVNYIKTFLTIEEFEKATYLVIAEEKFLPTPKKIVEKIKGNPTTLAKEEWLKVIGLEGNYSNLTQKTKKIVRKLGHVHLMDYNQQFQARKDFIELYINYNQPKPKNQETLEELPPVNQNALKLIDNFVNNFGAERK